MMSDELKEKTFKITNGDEVLEEIVGRAEAVARAKELSNQNGTRIGVERVDGMVTMVFAEGVLDTYVCETRDRKSNRNRRDRSDDRNNDRNEANEDEGKDDSSDGSSDDSSDDAGTSES